jgi:hypothetical protein
MKNAALQIFLGFCLICPTVLNAASVTTNAAPITASIAPPVSHIVASSSRTMTSEEWQELRTARQAALKANPDFAAKSAQLTAKMRAFQEKLDAAMVKTDPNLVPILVKFEGDHHNAQGLLPSQNH